MIALFPKGRNLDYRLHRPANQKRNRQPQNPEFLVKENIIQNQNAVGNHAQCRRHIKFLQRLQNPHKGKGNRRKEHRREKHPQKSHAKRHRFHIIAGRNQKRQRLCKRHPQKHHQKRNGRNHRNKAVRKRKRLLPPLFLQIFHKNRDKACRNCRCKNHIKKGTGNPACQQKCRRLHIRSVVCRQQLLAHHSQYFPKKGN